MNIGVRFYRKEVIIHLQKYSYKNQNQFSVTFRCISKANFHKYLSKFYLVIIIIKTRALLGISNLV